MSRYSYRISVGHFNDPRYRWPDINWSDELIFFFCAHATNIYYMQSAYYFEKGDYYALLSRLQKKKQRYNEQKARGKKVV